MCLPSNRFLGGGGGVRRGWGCRKDIQIAIIKTKNVGENRKNRKKWFLALSFLKEPGYAVVRKRGRVLQGAYPIIRRLFKPTELLDLVSSSVSSVMLNLIFFI